VLGDDQGDIIILKRKMPMFNKHSPQSSKRLYIYLTFFFFLTWFIVLSCTSRLTAPDVKPGVYGELYKPKTPGVYPAVILLHGSIGVKPANLSLAKNLSKHGYVSVVLDYYAKVGGLPPGSKAYKQFEKLDGWSRNVKNCVKYLQSLPEVENNRIGLVGFSRGGGLAMALSGQISSVKAVVAFYPSTLFVDRYSSIAPVLLLHGSNDKLIPLYQVENLYYGLLASGKTAELKVYEGAGHGFERFSKKRGYSPLAAKDARNRTIKFLDKYLKTS
jgi:carboxymethylenebutenolidase